MPGFLVGVPMTMKNSAAALFVGFLCCLSSPEVSSSAVGNVYCYKRSCHVKFGFLDRTWATAYGIFNDTLNKTGWDILNIAAGYSSEPASNDDIMYAAGFLEGVFTAEKIYNHYSNMHSIFFKNYKKLANKVQNFFDKQEHWMRENIRGNSSSPFWRHVSYIIAQYDGLIDGYNFASLKKLDKFAFQLLNGLGDLLDLTKVLDKNMRPDFLNMSLQDLKLYIQMNGFCSALIKILPGYENIYMGHSAWFLYSATSRIFKHMDFNIKDSHTGAKKLSFSSYPGFLESLDDFYLLSSKMVMLQTTNQIFNNSLYDLVTPLSLLAWHRVRVANMMATSGKEWASIVAIHNSGTYNNQYMVVDLKKIQQKKSLLDGALWVVEQIPRLVVARDMTPILRTGYWPSYNVPFFEEIYNLSGYPMVAKMDIDNSYQLASRAKIFRRDANNVRNLEDMKALLRSNDYKNDPYSESDSCKAICCRGDLGAGSAFGCYDTKVSDYEMAVNFQTDIINGPTHASGLKPFRWSDQYLRVPHIGLPKLYNFSFISTAPYWHN